MTQRPRILFVCEKWAECDPAHGPSNAHQNFIGSFRASGLGEHASFFFDEYAWRTRERCDAALLDAARAFCPDLVFATPVRGTDLNPEPATLRRLRDDCGARVVMLNGDTYDEAGVAWCESFAAAVDCVVVQDCYSLYPKLVRDRRKYLDLWTPQDPALFHRGGDARPIAVSFLGSVARYPERKRALGVLAGAGIEVLRGGGQAEAPLAIENYAAVLRQSRITINFAKPVFDTPRFQCKGRVIEAALSGALLFEQANPETDRWLSAGIHYVAFDTERDLLAKIRHYLAHEDERAALAAAGTEHAERSLSAGAYWRRVLDVALAPRVPA